MSSRTPHAHDWLPLDWHPDHFDTGEVKAALSVAVAEPGTVPPFAEVPRS